MSCCLIASIASSGRAAKVTGYAVAVKASGDDTLDAMIRSSSRLVALHNAHYPGDFAFGARIRADYEIIETALQSRGYYDGQPTIRIQLHDATAIDGRDPSLLERLKSGGCRTDCHVSISVSRNTQYRIGEIKFLAPQNAKLRPGGGSSREIVHLSPEVRPALRLRSGMPAIAGDILSARDKMLDALLESGHAEARVDPPKAFVDTNGKRLNLEFTVHEGPIVAIGPIKFEGQERTHLSFLQTNVHLQIGDRYRPSKLEAARQSLAESGLFSYVGVKNAPPLVALAHGAGDKGLAMPIRFSVKEAKRHTISAQAGYSTDLGGRVGVDWSYRNVFGRAERLKLTALMTGVGGSAQQGLGYDAYADFSKPNVLRGDQTLDVRVEAIRQLLYSYHQTAFIARGGIVRNLGRRWTASASLSLEQEEIQQFGVVNDYFIASLPVMTTYDSTDLVNPLASATHGVRLNLSITPSESFQKGHSFFTLMSATVSHYVDLHRFGLTKPGRTIIALRGILGTVQGATTYQIPPDQRLYAGGPASVRGFRYQGIGPQKGKYAIGGTSLDAGTIELRQRLFGKFGMAAFTDAGQVGAGSRPFQGKVRVGYGAGVRYDTPIGPVRLDIAVPVNRPQNGDKWEFYVGLGETF